MEDKDELAEELERDRKFRAMARAAGLPYSDTPFDSEEPFDPYICDVGMTAEDNHLMWALVQADCDRLREKQAEDTRKRWVVAALVGAFAVCALALLLTTPAVSSDFTYPVPTVAADFETDENSLIEAALLEKSTVIEDCTVTHYDCCVQCCGKPDGITASGVRATPGVTVAVDPAVIPLGSDVLVDYGDGFIHYYRADDIGGAIKGSHIDLCVSSHQEALLAGVTTATVYWVPPIGG